MGAHAASNAPAFAILTIKKLKRSFVRQSGSILYNFSGISVPAGPTPRHNRSVQHWTGARTRFVRIDDYNTQECQNSAA